jgi:uncharacterized protein YgbK (DUF1537 family)
MGRAVNVAKPFTLCTFVAADDSDRLRVTMHSGEVGKPRGFMAIVAALSRQLAGRG